jgi:hypothetical protein
MKIDYAQKCKKKTGSETYKTMHAAINGKTLCGEELNEMWFVHSSYGMTGEEITRSKCKNELLKPIS